MVTRRRKSRKRKSSGAAAFLLAAFFAALLAAAAMAWVVVTPFGPDHEIFVEVAPGSSTARIGQQMEAAGIVRSRYAFDILRFWKLGTLRAGEYRFDHPAPVTRFIRGLHAGMFLPGQLRFQRARVFLISPHGWSKLGLFLNRNF